jgi:prolyl-tRNA synthetase
MRYSRLFGKTSREKPRNADSLSHQLLLRAGFLRPAPGGGFLLLPLAQRALAKLEALLSRELEACGVESLGLPGGRKTGDSDLRRSLRLQRRDKQREYPFTDSHEVALSMLGGNLGLSYRDLPLLLAGRQWVNREDARPNWGLLAGPEFLFHSIYALCQTADEAANHLQNVSEACRRFLESAGVAAFPLSSTGEPGDIEYAIATDLSARPLLVCDRCGYRADAATAVSRAPEWPQEAEPGEVRAVFGPALIQVEPLAQFLGIPVHQTTKTLLFEAGGRVVAACVAGVYDVSEAKLARVLNCRDLGLAAPDTVCTLTNANVGYAGPIGLPPSVEVVWDLSTEHRTNFEAGANRTDHHLINLNFGRDLPRPAMFFDIRMSRAGERCGQCGQGTLSSDAAIPLGHVSLLGDLYSETLGARFLDAGKATRPMQIGCAGLDLTAVLAAIVEQNSGARGIVWPPAVAPFEAHLVSLAPAEAEAESLHSLLTEAGVDVLWDDRAESAGVKFADADLIGLPIRLVLSKRTAGQVEWKPRHAEQGELISPDEAVARLAAR